MANAGDVPDPTVGGAELLFVYGTLRRGGGMEALLEGCHFLRAVRVRGSIYELDGFPALVQNDVGWVEGELWACPPETLLRLDAYEGVEVALFRRIRTRAAETDCWTYVAGPGLLPSLREELRIADGVWSPDRNSLEPN